MILLADVFVILQAAQGCAFGDGASALSSLALERRVRRRLEQTARAPFEAAARMSGLVFIWLDLIGETAVEPVACARRRDRARLSSSMKAALCEAGPSPAEAVLGGGRAFLSPPCAGNPKTFDGCILPARKDGRNSARAMREAFPAKADEIHWRRQTFIPSRVGRRILKTILMPLRV